MKRMKAEILKDHKTPDVEGLDAGRKVAIMASIAFHSRVVFPNVFTEGITKITAKDIEYAKEFDSVIKTAWCST